MKKMSYFKGPALAAIVLALFVPTVLAVETAPVGANTETNANVTLDFKDADINNVLRILSLKSGVNIVAGPEVQGTVTIRLSDVPWDRALEVVLRTYGYVYEREGNIIRVTTRERVEQEDLTTETFVLNYITAQEVEESISEILSERGKIKSFGRTNTVIVTDVASNITKIGQVIKRLDKATPQAYVDSKVITTELGKTENLGIDWNLAGGITSGSYRPTTFPFQTGTRNKSGFGFLGGEVGQFFPEVQDTTLTSGTASSDSSANPGNPKDFPIPSAVISNQDFKFGRLDFSEFSSVLNLIK